MIIFNPDYLNSFQQIQQNKVDIAKLKKSLFILTPRGEWDDATQYDEKDLVNYDGDSYFAVVANMGYAPTSNPDKWQLLAERGEQGATGSQGEQGEQGTSIVNITATNSERQPDGSTITTITIYLSDGTTKEFTITAEPGEQGAQGVPGETGEPGKYITEFIDGSTTEDRPGYTTTNVNVLFNDGTNEELKIYAKNGEGGAVALYRHSYNVIYTNATNFSQKYAFTFDIIDDNPVAQITSYLDLIAYLYDNGYTTFRTMLPASGTISNAQQTGQNTAFISGTSGGTNNVKIATQNIMGIFASSRTAIGALSAYVNIPKCSGTNITGTGSTITAFEFDNTMGVEFNNHTVKIL